MEHMFKKFLSVAVLVSAVAIQADSPTTPGVLTFINQRSVSFDAARRNAGEFGKTHQYDQESWSGIFSLNPGYQRTFRGGKIAECLFGELLVGNPNNTGDNCNRNCDDSCGVLLVQGSDVENRAERAILADYFYLPTDFSSVLSFKPQISNFFIDFNFYLGLDEWWKGGYLRLYAPFVHTKRTLHMREAVVNSGSVNNPAGYFTPTEMVHQDLLPNATAFLAGAAPESQDGVTFHGLCFSKIRGGLECDKVCDSSRTRNGFGEIRAELGWDFWQNEDSHFGLNLQAAAPTANRPKAEFLFDAVVGNGKHWELGGGATGHYTFWRGCDETRQFSINMDLSVLHLFGSRQQRVFDLAGKPLSRYMLAARFRPANSEDTLNGRETDVSVEGTLATSIFDNAYSPVANLTTQDVKVSVNAQVDFNVWFNFTAGGFSADLGYDLWYSGCEKFDCSDDKCPDRCCPVNFAPNTWALKGNEFIFGFDTTVDPVTRVALSASTSDATITDGAAQDITTALINDNINNPLLAFAGDTQLNAVDNPAAEFIPINTSIQTEFITAADLVAAAASAKRGQQLSNKVWAHFQYTWDREGWIPYLGAGAAGEFGGRGCKDECNNNSSSNCNDSCDNCVKCTTSQWTVWVKTGFQF
jgi:hypothetical protein